MGNQNSLAANNLSYQIPAAAGSSAQPIPSTGGGSATSATGEPLESYIKEKQRDDHLKNLGFKRSKSLRKSISKRLKRKNKHKQQQQADHDTVDSNPLPEADPNRDAAGADPNTADIIQTAAAKPDEVPNKPLKKVDNRDRNPGSVERIDRTLEDHDPPVVLKQKVPTAIAKKTKKRPLVGDQPEPLPSHVQVGKNPKKSLKSWVIKRLKNF